MPKIHFRAQDYVNPYDQLNTSGFETVSCSRLDLVRCAVSVGHPGRLPWYRIKEIGFPRAIYESLIEKAGEIWFNIDVVNGKFIRHRSFESHSLDKQRFVSYNIGMTFAKLYSQRCLDIPNLLHLEFYKRTKSLVFAQSVNKTPKEPDLAGQSRDGKWHIFEAKGCSNGANFSNMMKKAKQQACNVLNINGLSPATRTACGTNYNNSGFHTTLRDPPSSDGGDFKIDPEEFLRAYYASYTLIRDADITRRFVIRYRGRAFEVVNLKNGDSDMFFGLDKHILSCLIEGRVMDIYQIYLRLEPLDDGESERYSVGPDGFIVGLLDKFQYEQ